LNWLERVTVWLRGRHHSAGNLDESESGSEEAADANSETDLDDGGLDLEFWDERLAGIESDDPTPKSGATRLISTGTAVWDRQMESWALVYRHPEQHWTLVRWTPATAELAARIAGELDLSSGN